MDEILLRKFMNKESIKLKNRDSLFKIVSFIFKLLHFA